MRPKIPFPSGPGDWRYDPTTGRLIDASKAPPELIEPVSVALGVSAQISGEPGEGEPITAAEPGEIAINTEITVQPGEALPPIKTARAKRSSRS